jgi:hypothetical protein
VAREHERIQIANMAWGQLDELLHLEHPTNEDLAQQIYLSLRSYRDLMRVWLDRMSLER